jgi:hypothetical protein
MNNQKDDIARFVKIRYPNGRWSHSARAYLLGFHAFTEYELFQEMEAERDAWKLGHAVKPEWIK